MSKKDYIAIANVIKDLDIDKYIKIALSNKLAHVFQMDNNNFDKQRFFDYIESDKRLKDFTD